MRSRYILSDSWAAGRALVLLLCVAIGAEAQRDDSRTKATVSRTPVVTARTELRKVEVVDTIKSYEERIGRAAPGEAKASLQLSLASFLATNPVSRVEPEWQVRSGQLYREVIASTQGQLQLRASNNYCAQLLRQNSPAEAVQIMQAQEQKLDDPSMNRIARSRGLYNYGKALQLSGDQERAWQVLTNAAKADPTFGKAMQAAGEALVQSAPGETGIPLMVELTSGQLACWDYDGTGDSLRRALSADRWNLDGSYPQLLNQLIRYFTAAQIGPDEFRRDWLPLLNRPRRFSRSARVAAGMIARISEVYLRPVQIMDVNLERIREHYAAWTRGVAVPDQERNFDLLSGFINMVGDRYQRREEPESLRRALERYCHAWALNTRNMEAGLSLVNLLLHDRDDAGLRLDPNDEILEQFVGQLFDTKGLEYSLDVGRDWERILKCHAILATIFERQGRWGPPDDATTAAFQWRMASTALRRLGASASATRELLDPMVRDGLRRAREHGW